MVVVVVAPTIAVAASAGLGMLAGVAMANRSRQHDSSASSAALRWGAPTTTAAAPRCAACGGTGREECRLCARWSDGDCSGCRSCDGTGRAPCRSCGGSGTGRRAPVRVSSAPPRPHLKA